MGWIGAEPSASRRKLMSTAEGIDQLTQALRDLKAELDKPEISWDDNHG